MGTAQRSQACVECVNLSTSILPTREGPSSARFCPPTSLVGRICDGVVRATLRSVRSFHARLHRGQFRRPIRPSRTHSLPMHVLKAILLKLVSALLFAVMSALVRFLGEKYSVGQIVFFHFPFTILPVMIIYALPNELPAAFTSHR